MKKYIVFAFCILLTVPVFASKDINININNVINRELEEIIRMKDDSTKVERYLSLIESYDVNLSTDQKLDYAYSALNISRKIGWKKGIGIAHYYSAWIYFFDNNRKLAIDNFLKAAEFSDDLSIQVNSYGTVANIYSWDKDHDKAIHYAKIGGELVHHVYTDDKTKAEALIYLGDVYRACGNKKEERNHYLYAFDITHKNHRDDPSYHIIRMIIYVNLSNKNIINDPFSVLHYSMSIRNIHEKSSTLEKYKTLAFLIKISTGYISSVNSEQLKQLQLDAEAKQKKIYILGIIILSLLLVAVIWQNFSRKKANNELAKANEMKSRFFGILNHDLRRPVAGLINYLQMKTEAPEMIDPAEAANFEHKTMDTAKNLLENMEDLLFWCKDQMQSFTPEFRVVEVSKLFDDTQAFFRYDENTHISFANPSNLKIKSDENYVKTIMRNLTSNAISATTGMETPEIIWRSYEKQDKIVLSIFNNGKKMSPDKIEIFQNKESKKEKNTAEGLGLKIIKDLAKSIDCEVKLNQNIAEGTEFLLLFKKN